MIRIVLGIVAGFISWPLVWFSIEKTLSAVFPGWYGSDKQQFEEVLKNGGEFSPNSVVLILDVLFGAVSSLLAGMVAAWVSLGNATAVLVVGVLLLALGVAKMVMSWKYVPLWYHIIFTGMLLPMAWLGGRLGH